MVLAVNQAGTIDEAAAAGRATYLRGCGLVLLAGLTLSLGVFFIRSATASHAWQYIFWRALSRRRWPGRCCGSVSAGRRWLRSSLASLAWGS